MSATTLQAISQPMRQASHTMSRTILAGRCLERQRFGTVLPQDFLISLPPNLTISSDPKTKVVLIKTAPSPRLMNEIELELCQDHKSIRQLVDVIENPQSLVLEFLDKTLYHASCEQKLDRCDIKRAVKTVLDGLAVLHAHKRAHTGQYEAMSSTLLFLTILMIVVCRYQTE